MMLQLWTTVNGQPEDLLGEIEVDNETLCDAQSSPADALKLIQDLTAESADG